MKPNGKSWFVAIARPQMDARAARDLVSREIETILPLDFEHTVVGKKKSTQPVLWLSPYIFVHISNEEFNVVLQTFGIEGFVSLGRDGDGDRQPTEAPGQLIHDLKEDQIANIDEATRRVRAKESLYKLEDRVEIIDGSGKGRTGTVRRIAHGSLWLDGLGAFPVRVDESDVCAVFSVAKGRAA